MQSNNEHVYYAIINTYIILIMLMKALLPNK